MRLQLEAQVDALAARLQAADARDAVLQVPHVFQAAARSAEADAMHPGRVHAEEG